MTRLTYGRALNVLAENVSNLREHRHYDLAQRRNNVVDIFGSELSSHTVDGLDDSASFRISISPDLIYYSRFGFKIEIWDSQATQFQLFIDGIDMTPYFKAQWRGQFLNGNGIFPNNQLGRYDVLKACGYMDEKKRERVLRPGYKDVRIYGNAHFKVKVYNYLKYSHCIR